MDFAYTQEEEACRQELRVWLEPNWREHRAQWGKDEDEFVQKLSFTRAYMKAAQLADSMLGLHSQLWKDSPHAVDDGHWAFQSLFSRRYGIAGGTDEVQKNIISERQLGLPK